MLNIHLVEMLFVVNLCHLFFLWSGLGVKVFFKTLGYIILLYFTVRHKVTSDLVFPYNGSTNFYQVIS